MVSRLRLTLWVVALGCRGAAESSPAPTDVSGGDAPGQDVASTCRPVSEPWSPGAPLRLPCERTREPCNGVDDDLDGFTDPKCPTQACASDADCTYGALMPDADCCTRFCGADSCGAPDGCGGTCGCDEPGLNASCNSIDGTGLEASPFECWGVLCPPGQKCVEGQCRAPGKRLPGETCASGLDCPINAGCIPSPEVPDSARCLTFCQAFPCPAGSYCSEYHHQGPIGGVVVHETCQILGVCTTGADRCAREYTACLGDPACLSALQCAADSCEPPEGSGGGSDAGGACMRGCVAAADPSAAVEAYRACLATYCPD